MEGHPYVDSLIGEFEALIGKLKRQFNVEETIETLKSELIKETENITAADVMKLSGRKSFRAYQERDQIISECSKEI